MPDSSRTRPAKPALSRASIVSAALGLIDESGVDAVSLRRVAKAVDTAAPSLYVYVADRPELLRHAFDLAVAEVELPVEADGDWRARLELLVHRTVAALAAHRDIAMIGLTEWATGPNTLRIIEEQLRLLLQGEIARDACAWAVDLLGKHIASSALEQAGGGDGHGNAGTDWIAAHRTVLPAEDYPTISALLPSFERGDSAVRADWKLRVLIDGILAQP